MDCDNKDDYFVWYMGTIPLSFTEHQRNEEKEDYMGSYMEELSEEEQFQYFGDDETAEIIIEAYEENGEKYKRVMNEIKNK